MSHPDLPTYVTDLLPSNQRRPYYVYAPPYTRMSGGYRALHMLCHALNRKGQNAFIYNRPEIPHGFPGFNPDLLAQRLTQEFINQHFEQGRTPIVIYPEGINANPMGADVVVRFIMNFPGLIGKKTAFPEEDIKFGYSKELAIAGGQPENVLYIPTSDPTIFYPPPPGTKRSGKYFYAHKYLTLHNGKLFPQTEGCTEISREISQQEMADLFRSAELLYCYENTAVAGEATMCGCPAVYLPNEFLVDKIARNELSMDGYAWGDLPSEVMRAKATVGNAYVKYLDVFAKFWTEIDHFIAVTQDRAAQTPYDTKVQMTVPSWRDVGEKEASIETLKLQTSVLARELEGARRRAAGWE